MKKQLLSRAAVLATFSLGASLAMAQTTPIGSRRVETMKSWSVRLPTAGVKDSPAILVAQPA